MAEAFAERIRTKYDEKERQVGPELMLFHQRMIMLQIVDTQWKDHLYGLDHLKEGIGLRGYGQRDPLVEYKKESFDMFQALMDRIDEEILRWVFLYSRCRVRSRRSGATATAEELKRSRLHRSLLVIHAVRGAQSPPTPPCRRSSAVSEARLRGRRVVPDVAARAT
jgi:preprotein translocase subunit SecA